MNADNTSAAPGDNRPKPDQPTRPPTCRRTEALDLGIGALFGMIHEAVVVMDPTTECITLWNKAATQIFGWQEEEAIGLNINALVPRHLRKAHRRGVDRYNKGYEGTYVDKDSLIELPAVTKDGHNIRIEFSLNTIHPKAEPDRRYVIAIIRDITRRKRLEALATHLLESMDNEGPSGLAHGFHIPEAPEGIPHASDMPTTPLTKSELTVLEHVLEGHTAKKTAQLMFISESTVKSYLDRINQKLETKTKAQAAGKAVKLGLLS